MHNMSQGLPPWGAGPPPWGDGPPPWGDGPPPWGDGPPPWESRTSSDLRLDNGLHFNGYHPKELPQFVGPTGAWLDRASDMALSALSDKLLTASMTLSRQS